MDRSIVRQQLPVGGKLLEICLMGIGFFSAFPIFVLFPTGRGSGVQVSFFLAMVAASLIVAQNLKGQRLVLRLSKADWALLGFTLSILLSVVAQLDWLTADAFSLFLNNFLGAYLPTLFIYFVVRIGMSSRNRIEGMTKWILAAAVVSCVYGSIDYFVAGILERPNLALLFNNPAFGGDQLVRGEYFMSRAAGFMSEPGLLVAFLLAVVPLAFYRKSPLLIGLILLGIFLTFSPTMMVIGLLGPLIVLSPTGRALLFKVIRRGFVLLIPATWLLLMLTSLWIMSGWNVNLSDAVANMQGLLIDRVPFLGSGQPDISVATREDSIYAGLKIWEEKPIFGQGYAMISEKVGTYQDPAVLSRTGGRAEKGVQSGFIQLLATTGLLGGITISIWAFQVFLSAWRAARRIPAFRPLVWAWASGFTLMIVHLAFISPQWPQLHFVPVVAAVTASLPAGLSSEIPYS